MTFLIPSKTLPSIISVKIIAVWLIILIVSVSIGSVSTADPNNNINDEKEEETRLSSVEEQDDADSVVDDDEAEILGAEEVEGEEPSYEYIQTMFLDLDADQDGKLSWFEVNQKPAKGPSISTKASTSFDLAGSTDFSIPKHSQEAEFAAVDEEVEDGWDLTEDKDGDGMLDLDEFVQMIRAMTD